MCWMSRAAGVSMGAGRRINGIQWGSLTTRDNWPTCAKDGPGNVDDDLHPRAENDDDHGLMMMVMTMELGRLVEAEGISLSHCLFPTMKETMVFSS